MRTGTHMPHNITLFYSGKGRIFQSFSYARWLRGGDGT